MIKNGRINVKCLKSQEETIKILAEKKGLSITEFVLSRCLNVDFEEEVSSKLNKILKEIGEKEGNK